MRTLFAFTLVAILAASGSATAQGTETPAAGAPGVITQGSGNTSIGGLPATRQGDATDGSGTVVGGSKDVFINGKPAVTTGDRTGCGGVTVGSGGGVFINGKPAARAGDLTTGCPGK